MSVSPLGKQPVDQYDISNVIHGLVEALDQQLGPETASWMAGYARVTYVYGSTPGRILAATPLFVERVRVPPAGGK